VIFGAAGCNICCPAPIGGNNRADAIAALRSNPSAMKMFLQSVLGEKAAKAKSAQSNSARMEETEEAFAR
jgi:hypothetical protein